MDIHKGEKALDPEIVRKAHLMDKAIEYKYGVRHIHYYVNAKEGMGFCLMSGPDKKTCAKVHKESHGDIANNIIEVEESTYENIMGIVSVDHGMVQTKKGLPDTGRRFILCIEFVGIFHPTNESTEKVLEILRRNDGRLLKLNNRKVVVSFVECSNALHAAKIIAGMAESHEKAGIDYKVGLVSGTPVSLNGCELFDEAIEQATYLARAAPHGVALVCSKTGNLYNENFKTALDKSKLRVIDNGRFIDRLFRCCNYQMENGSISVDSLCAAMAISRPQMYRKIRAISGKSPKEFIRELRLSKAAKLISTGACNMSEIAYQLGYGQPATFSRHFKQRFGTSPSKARKILADSR